MSSAVQEGSEARLIEDLKQRSPEAFEALVATYGRRLLSVAFRITRNMADAEDAVQESLLKVVQSIQSFKEQSSLYTWLYRIVANQCLMHLRKRKTLEAVLTEPLQPEFEMGQHVQAMADWTQLPDQEARAEELRQFFEECVDELPEHYRLAYILKDIEELSEDDVCRILQLSKPAMKNRVHRARLVIREQIEERFFRRDQ